MQKALNYANIEPCAKEINSMSKTIPRYGIKIETNVGYYVWLTATGTSPLRKKAKQYDTRAGAVADRNTLAESSPSVKLIVEKLDKENPAKMRAVKAKIMREKAAKEKALAAETTSKENPPASEVTENVAPELGADTESLPVVETPPEGTSKAEEPAEEKASEAEILKESDPDTEPVQESAESVTPKEAVTEA